MLNVDSITYFDSKNPGPYKIDKFAYFVIEFQIKDITPLIDYTGLLKIYNIDSTDQHLPVFIDSLLAYRPEKTYYELGDVQSVKVSTEESSGLRFINIITLFPKPKHLSVF